MASASAPSAMEPAKDLILFHRVQVNTSMKSTETRDELSITLYLQSEINFCSVRMPINA